MRRSHEPCSLPATNISLFQFNPDLGIQVQVTDGNDTFVAAAVDDVDLIQSSVNRGLGDNQENLQLLGAAITGYGNGLSNSITGNAQNNSLFGYACDDAISGGDGADTGYGGEGIDSLNGGEDADIVDGSNGSDTVNGGLGADTLCGGTGADAFVFSTTLGGGNVDSIVGFSVVDDIIHLDVSIFTGIGLGALAANAFVIGAAALDADDRIIYNAATGALFYDADGDGAGAAVQFATLAPGLGGLTSADFFGIPGGP